MKLRRVVGVLLVAGVAALLVVFRNRIHFDVQGFAREMRGVGLGHVAAGVAAIYAAMWLRSVRWAMLMKPQRRVRAAELVGPQLAGFAAVGLFGRLADLTRPYLIARKTGTVLSAQVAVYTVERIFDLGAAALVFSAATAWIGGGVPHAAAIERVGRGSLVGTVALAGFAVALRVGGEHAATVVERVMGVKVGARVREFRDGLKVITGVGEFGAVAAISLAMWGLIAGAYVESVHAFVRTPQLAGMSFAGVMVLMASSIAGSAVQMPVVGWFSQMAVMAGVLTGVFGVPVEAAAACGALQYIICSLSVVPGGLVCAQMGHVSLRDIAQQSQNAQ